VATGLAGGGPLGFCLDADGRRMWWVATVDADPLRANGERRASRGEGGREKRKVVV
jgi:hypothetical protein